MTFRHIRIFVTVCECGSATAAAKKLFIAQPSVSLAISELEKHYNVRLFDRISRRLHITEAGKQLFDYGVHILSLYSEMEDCMKSRGSSDILRVGTSITIGTRLLPDLVKRFEKIEPNAKINAIIDNSESIEESIINGDIDLGLIEGIAHMPQIIAEKFMDDELVLLCGGNHPLCTRSEVTLEELSGFDFILREKGSATRELFDSLLLVHNMSITPMWESISTSAIIGAIAQGIGISVLPYRLAEEDLEAGNIHRIPIKELSLKRNFFIIYHQSKFFSETAKLFMDTVRKAKSYIPKIK